MVTVADDVATVIGVTVPVVADDGCDLIIPDDAGALLPVLIAAVAEDFVAAEASLILK